MAKEKTVADNPVVSVSFPRDLWEKLSIIAIRRNLTRFEAIEKYAGPAIEREYRKVKDRESHELGENGAA